jgi:subtilisin family serine protease
VRHQSPWGRRPFAALLASGVAMGAATFTGVTAAHAEPVTPTTSAADTSTTPKTAPEDTLGARDVSLLAAAEAKGEKTVTVIIATDKGDAAKVADSVRKLGGTVVRRFDKVGYVLAEVPTGKVRRTAKLPGIAGLDLDDVLRLPDPKVDVESGLGKASVTSAAPGPTTPAVNAYLPANEIGAVDFRKAHPTWDGRGITVGIMDSGVDLDHPALQKTTTGARKIVDWVTATDPTIDSDPTWRPMTASVTGPTFSYKNATWTAPAGTWSINTFAESITTDSEVAGDVNRDGDTTDVFGVLYDPESHDIRVDTNQNHDFTDDAVMRPYREKFDVGHFGTDNPATDVHESMPFVVEYRKFETSPGVMTDFVNIGITEGAHATHVAGITAGNDLFGDADFDGVAPGAQIVSARACNWGGGCTNAALTTGMVDLVANRHVNVINLSIGGLNALNDGSDAQSILYNRLITDYGVQVFISAGNSGPGLNTVGSPSTSTAAVSVAASVSDDTYLANYGAVTRKPMQLFNFSSRGPREDGGFKPGISAPGSAISSVPMWQEGQPVADAGYPLPAGYAMFNGTSMAAPEATGGAALLLSAAKAKDLAVTPAAMRQAMYSSTKPIADTSTAAQGNGLLTVPAAWSLLAKGIKTARYTSSAPVCTAISDYLTKPGKGEGIYNRCGQTAGSTKNYTVTITRTSGPDKTVVHQLSWVGDKGFSSPRSVTLPLNKPVKVVVMLRAAAGLNSAILRVDDPATPGYDYEMLNTVVAPAKPAKPDYRFAVDTAVDRNSYRSSFIDVPAGAAALQVNFSGIATGSRLEFLATDPYGMPVEGESLDCVTNHADPALCNPIERDYQNPMPGVWEIEVLGARTTPSLSNPYELIARVQGVTVNPSVVTLPSVTKGQASPVTWNVRNTFGPVTVSGKGQPLGSALVSRPTVGQDQTKEIPIEVPAGATSLHVAIKNPADLGADLDLEVYLDGKQVAVDADGDSDEKVAIANPAAGTYTAVVSGYSVPAGTTAFDYTDVYYTPDMGSVVASSASKTLAGGGTATISGSVQAGTVSPAPGRVLYGEMTVITDEGAVAGRGAVAVNEVK